MTLKSYHKTKVSIFENNLKPRMECLTFHPPPPKKKKINYNATFFIAAIEI